MSFSVELLVSCCTYLRDETEKDNSTRSRRDNQLHRLHANRTLQNNKGSHDFLTGKMTTSETKMDSTHGMHCMLSPCSINCVTA